MDSKKEVRPKGRLNSPWAFDLTCSGLWTGYVGEALLRTASLGALACRVEAIQPHSGEPERYDDGDRREDQLLFATHVLLQFGEEEAPRRDLSLGVGR